VDTATKDFTPGDLRVSDVDRDRAISELSEHFQAGRLTDAEFDERSARALQARTESDLAALFDDLPRKRPAATAPRPRPAAAGPHDVERPSVGLVPHLPVVRVMVAVALAAAVVGGLAGGFSGHHTLATVLPVLFVVAIVARLIRHHH
jgi:Domain of unknown function (DUF1707)